MELQQVRYFLALCETLNFTRAAEKCNVTQPSLTWAIQALEAEFGGPLLHRERSKTHLTELGNVVRPHLENLMVQAAVAKSRAKELACAGIAHRSGIAPSRGRVGRRWRRLGRARRPCRP